MVVISEKVLTYTFYSPIIIANANHLHYMPIERSRKSMYQNKPTVWGGISLKKFVSVLMVLTLAMTMVLALPAAAEGEKLSVYASFYPMYDFVLKVGGDKVTVSNMVPAGMEPHDWEPAASDIVGLENADVFIYNGAGMEHWVDKVLHTLSNKDLVVVNASDGLTLLEGHHHHSEEGEEAHEEEEEHAFDPHVWLGPLSAKAQMEVIKNALVKADPTNAVYYEENYTKYAAEFDALDAEFKQALEPLSKKEIVVSHQAFGYLCVAYGLSQESIEGLTPDSEPDPARMAEIIDFVKEHKVSTIFFEELVSPKVAETIASATGAVAEVLSPIEGLSDEQIAAGSDYFSVMRQNLAALKKALQ